MSKLISGWLIAALTSLLLATLQIDVISSSPIIGGWTNCNETHSAAEVQSIAEFATHDVLEHVLNETLDLVGGSIVKFL